MPTNFIFNNGGNNADFSDVFIPVSAFPQGGTTGGLWGWGLGTNGTLGDNTTVSKSSPVQTIASGTNWKQVSVSFAATLNGPTVAAIKTDGTLWGWGQNSNGQLGDNTVASKSSPVQTISGGITWKQVAAGLFFVGAIKTDGTLWLSGRNNYGQLGNNTITNVSSPIQTVSGGTNWKMISANRSHASAIKTDGTLWLWGQNSSGQLGNNAVANVSSPIQTVSGGTNWKQVSVGDSFTAAIKTDGTLWLWGTNGFGQMGQNVTGVGARSSPVQTVSGGTNWKLVSAGTDVVGAIKTDGTLWLWGKGNYGRLGDNTAVDKSSPVQTVSGGTNWKQISANPSVGAIKTDGTLWTWGWNRDGTLGNNIGFLGSQYSSPIQTIASGTNWNQVSVGGQSGTFGSSMFAVKNNF